MAGCTCQEAMTHTRALKICLLLHSAHRQKRPVHAVLCSQSGWYPAACKGDPLKESSTARGVVIRTVRKVKSLIQADISTRGCLAAKARSLCVLPVLAVLASSCLPAAIPSAGVNSVQGAGRALIHSRGSETGGCMLSVFHFAPRSGSCCPKLCSLKLSLLKHAGHSRALR